MLGVDGGVLSGRLISFGFGEKTRSIFPFLKLPVERTTRPKWAATLTLRRSLIQLPEWTFSS